MHYTGTVTRTPLVIGAALVAAVVGFVVGASTVRRDAPSPVERPPPPGGEAPDVPEPPPGIPEDVAAVLDREAGGDADRIAAREVAEAIRAEYLSAHRRCAIYFSSSPSIGIAASGLSLTM